jgi:hypothetical protein
MSISVDIEQSLGARSRDQLSHDFEICKKQLMINDAAARCVFPARSPTKMTLYFSYRYRPDQKSLYDNAERNRQRALAGIRAIQCHADAGWPISLEGNFEKAQAD